MSFLARLLILLCLIAAPASAQTLTSVDCAAVFDDDGTRVGRLHGDREVFFEVDDIHFALRVSPTEISTGNIFFYLNSTCQPPAYLAHETGGDASIMPSTVVVGRTVYLPTGAPFSGEVQSRGNPSSPSCTTFSYTKDLVLASVYVDLLPAYTPPFHVEAEPCSGGGPTSLPTASHMGFLTTLVVLLVITGTVGLALLRRRSSAVA